MKKIKLKRGAPPLQWTNWEGVKVYTVSARYVDWVEFERFPDNEKILSLIFVGLGGNVFNYKQVIQACRATVIQANTCRG